MNKEPYIPEHLRGNTPELQEASRKIMEGFRGIGFRASVIPTTNKAGFGAGKPLSKRQLQRAKR